MLRLAIPHSLFEWDPLHCEVCHNLVITSINSSKVTSGQRVVNTPQSAVFEDTIMPDSSGNYRTFCGPKLNVLISVFLYVCCSCLFPNVMLSGIIGIVVSTLFFGLIGVVGSIWGVPKGHDRG